MLRDPDNRWLPYLMILLGAVISITVFLAEGDWGIPMGDSYIHFSYARNLALHHEYSYYLGSIEGIGSTSLLWVLILAAFQLLGIPPEVSAIGLGIILLIVSGMMVYELTLRVVSEFPSRKQSIIGITAAFLTVIPGSMVWLALSGMEAILFLCLSLIALRLFDLKRWAWAGLILGLLILTRTEGLILAGSIGLVEIVRQRKIPKSLILTGFIVLIIIVPWLLYLYDREGILATASYQGRVVMVSESNSRISSHPVISRLISFNPVVYFVSWVAFLFLYASGAAGLPGPNWGLRGSLLGTQIEFPYLGWLAVFFVCIPLIIFGIISLWKKRSRFLTDNSGKRLIAAITIWVGLHNLAYAFFISHIGAAGRYAPMNHILFWLLLFFGGFSIQKRAYRFPSLLFLGALLIMSVVYWQRVYGANIQYNREVRIAAATYIADYLPSNILVGATDLGPIGYFSERQVVDLIGHVNKEIGPFREAGGSNADYLHHKELCYLMLYSTKGAAGLDFADELGYRSDERFDLVSEVRYEIPLDVWRLGSEPLRNYMPAVELFRIDWHDPGLCK